MKANPHPPRWAERLLARLAAPHLLEELQGDLLELFHQRLQQGGASKARLGYLLDLLRLIHPRLWRNQPSQYSSPHPILMLHHSLLLSFRTFKRYKGSFLINLIGLSTGLAAVLLIYLWVNDEVSFDRFNQKDSRLYQVMRKVTNEPTGIDTYENNSDLLAPALRQVWPEIEHIVPVSEPLPLCIVSSGEKKVKARGRFAGKDFFKVFTYPLRQGDPDQVLEDKHAIVISTDLATKLFGTAENIVGKTITWQEKPFGDTYTVSGIFEPATRSSNPFDFLATNEQFIEKNPMDVHWDSNTVETYLTLKEGVDAHQFNAKIRDFVRNQYKAAYGTKDLQGLGTLFLRRYSDKYLYNHYENGAQAGGRIDYIILFSTIALFILLIACINFMNLSTARASRRIKEVGIKKAMGVSRRTLIAEYLGEALLLTTLAQIAAVGLVYLILPEFNFITGKPLTLSWDWPLVWGTLAITLLTGLVAGSYPALYLSGFQPAAVLKGKLPTSMSELWARKGLVIFQFSISILLMVAVVILYQQIHFVQTRNLGYDKDHVISFERQGKLNEGLESFLAEVKNIPGVVNASGMSGDLAGNHSGGGGIDWPGKTHRVEFAGSYVNEDLIETLGLEMAAGRTFSRQFGSDSSAVIFNEMAIAAMGLKDPIGKTVKLWGNEKQIIGVVKNFHYESLYQTIGPFFLAYAKNNSNILVKILAGRERATLARLATLYQGYNPGVALDYKFLDEVYQAQYMSEQRVAELSKYFAAIAILISCLGLFGLAAFTAERRRKEMGIRKVLGASELGIVYLLSSGFTKLVGVSIVISLPLSYLVAKQWLNHFAFRIALEWGYFLGAGLVALLIAWLTVGMQAVKAARINPAQCLREE